MLATHRDKCICRSIFTMIRALTTAEPSRVAVHCARARSSDVQSCREQSAKLDSEHMSCARGVCVVCGVQKGLKVTRHAVRDVPY